MNRLVLRVVLLGLFAGSAASAASAVSAAESVRYVVAGKPAVTLDEKALAAMPRITVQAGAHGDAPSAWEGVALVEVLRAEGAPLGKALRGDALASYVRVTATDGYQVVFSLGELDADMGAAKVVLVDRHEGKPLDAKDGPLRLVVPGDQRPARWIRNVTTIELLSASTRVAKP